MDGRKVVIIDYSLTRNAIKHRNFIRLVLVSEIFGVFSMLCSTKVVVYVFISMMKRFHLLHGFEAAALGLFLALIVLISHSIPSLRPVYSVAEHA